MMKRMLLAKVAFWLIVLGAAVLLLPEARWPRWTGWVLLGTGTILGPLALLAGPRSRTLAPARKDRPDAR
jgi:hypothetical protein